MKLSYEYNEYVIGYIVTDKESGRSLNFQFEKFKPSNHPEPAYVLYSACEGDDTYRDWTEDEREEARNWLRSHNDVIELENAFTTAMYENSDFLNIDYSNGLSLHEILDAAENKND